MMNSVQNQLFCEILELLSETCMESIPKIKPLILKYAEAVKVNALDGMDRSIQEKNRELNHEKSRLLERMEMLKFEKDHDISDLAKQIEKSREEKIQTLALDMRLIEEKIFSFISEELGLDEDCYETEKRELIINLIQSLKNKYAEFKLLTEHSHVSHLNVILNNIEHLVDLVSPYGRYQD